MKINLQLLYLCAAIFNQDPLQMLVSWSFQTKDKMEAISRRLQCLKGVIPDPLLEQIIAFLEQLINNKGGPLQFTYTNKSDEINAAIVKWTALISEDTSWLNDKVQVTTEYHTKPQAARDPATEFSRALSRIAAAGARDTETSQWFVQTINLILGHEET